MRQQERVRHQMPAERGVALPLPPPARRRRRSRPVLLSLRNLLVAALVMPAIFGLLQRIGGAQMGAGSHARPLAAAMISPASPPDGPAVPHAALAEGMRLASRSAGLPPGQPAPLAAGKPQETAPHDAVPQDAVPQDAVRHVLLAEEVMGYAEGRGLSHDVGAEVAGTQCALGVGAMLTWMRDRPGGSGCRVTLFRGGRLAPGWRVEAVTLRLGHGARVPGADPPVNGAAHRARIVLDAAELPLDITVLGAVPLAGARFWAALDEIVLSGPPGAGRWQPAFAPAQEAPLARR